MKSRPGYGSDSGEYVDTCSKVSLFAALFPKKKKKKNLISLLTAQSFSPNEPHKRSCRSDFSLWETEDHKIKNTWILFDDAF